MSRSQLIQALRAPARPTVSVEFFPPKTPEAGAKMLEVARALRPLGIDFASLTYGAGGTSRDTTITYGAELVKMDIPLIGHLTCVGHSQAELTEVIAGYDAAGFSGILALRGDPPGRFAVGVAGFPERHPDATDDLSDTRFLAGKVSAGADFVTTQLFLDNEDYFRFVARARAAGVTVPILPGIMPVLSLKQARNFCGFCKARIPEALVRELEACGDDEEAQRKVGVSWAVRQVRGLVARGAPGYHVYILNRAESALDLFAQLKS